MVLCFPLVFKSINKIMNTETLQSNTFSHSNLQPSVTFDSAGLH